MNPSMAAMQNALLSGFCAQQQSETMRNMAGSRAKSPTMSENSEGGLGEPSSPEMSGHSMHPALPGQVSFCCQSNLLLCPSMVYVTKGKMW